MLVGLNPTAPNNARFAVLGASGVFIADLAGAKAKGSGAGWTISGVRTHYLSRDDQALLQQGELKVMFAPWKKLVSQQPNQAAELKKDDILRGDHYRQLALQLCQSGQSRAEGQAEKAQLVLRQQADSRAVFGTYSQVTPAADYCSYQNFYLQINR